MRNDQDKTDMRQLLAAIPKTDALLAAVLRLVPEVPEVFVKDAVHETLASLRARLLAGEADAVPGTDALAGEAAALAVKYHTPSLRPVINATGVVLHTNLGRAPLGEAAAEAVRRTADGYCDLEYDIEAGERGSRTAHVESLLIRLTGAENALAVNNNAAAVLLMLTALAKGGEVVVSRGELVEIGGSFRVPDIMESCGAVLREVGTTNKTRLSDYEDAVTPATRAFLKVHTSNFRLIGFTETPDRRALAALAHEKGLPALEDLGSGCLTDLDPLGVTDEPTVRESLAAGMDVVSFSGDKLLGGPQAGILAGKKDYIDRLRKHPLFRALRPGKMTLAALEQTLRSYVSGTEKTDVPVLKMLFAVPETLRKRAETLAARLRKAGVSAEAVAVEGCAGGGSLPGRTLPDYAVSLRGGSLSPDRLERTLRLGQPAVIGRIEKDRVLLQMRTVAETEEDALFAAVLRAFS